MNRKKLLELRKLTATPQMLQYAAQDKLESKRQYSWREVKGYTVGRYLRCTVDQGILKVAIFLTEPLKSGGKLPVYEIYLDPRAEDFLTYDCFQQKWRTAKADMLPWPSYVYHSGGDWMSDKGYWLVKKHLKVSQGGLAGVLEFQLRVRKKQLKQRHKRETDPWDMELAQTKPLPKDWDEWVKKVGIQENFIFYHYEKKGAKTGFCSYCEQEVPVKNPRHGKGGTCPRCRHKITYKAIGRMAGSFATESTFHLLQRCDVGFMIREFRGYRGFYKSDYRHPVVSVQEVRRSLFDPNAKPISAYNWDCYRNQYMRWIRTNPCMPSIHSWYRGRVYGKTLPTLFQKELRQTGLKVHLKQEPVTDPEMYLAYWNRIPQLEQMIHAGLPVLVQECFQSPHDYEQFFKGTQETALIKAMGIDAPRLKRLRSSAMGLRYLRWLRYEKQHELTLSDEVIRWFCQHSAEPNTFDFLHGKMTMLQIYNYLNRQMTVRQESYRWAMETWKDTLSMAKRLRLDLNDPYVYRPGDLHGRHQNYVEQINQKNEELQALDLAEKFPRVEEICAGIGPLYSYVGETYTVAVPRGILDIVREGRALNHCVGKSDRYLERIESRESYIFFLRRTAAPEEAYYTLEVEPDGTVRQKRTLGDVQNADIEDARTFLREWQQVISKRLTNSERQLALRSRELRTAEFAELAKSQTIIHTGALRGQRLLDVLLADLMENPKEADAPQLAAAA